MFCCIPTPLHHKSHSVWSNKHYMTAVILLNVKYKVFRNEFFYKNHHSKKEREIMGKGRKWFAQCDENNIKRQCRSTLKCCDTLGKKRVPNFCKMMLKRDAEKLPCTTNELSTFDKLEEGWSIPQGNSLGQIFKHSLTLGGSTQYFYRHTLYLWISYI